MTTLVAPTVDGPKDLPDLRAWLLARWAPGTLIDAAFPDAEWVHQTLRTSKLWWVERETCEILAESAPTIPADATLDLHALPTTSGFAVFSEDLTGLDANPDIARINPDGRVTVSGIMWGPTNISVDGGHTIHEALSIGIWSRPRGQRLDIDTIREAHPAVAELLDVIEPPPDEIIGDLFTYLGRTDWIVGTGPDEPLPGDTATAPVALASKAEDRRLLHALHALTRTTITSVADAPIPRHVARRAHRAGLDPSVRVLKLGGERVRHPSQAGTSDREWAHSWIVSSFWRWQAHGPGWSERKLILVPSHIRGPEDKPLIGRDRVWRVVPPKRP